MEDIKECDFTRMKHVDCTNRNGPGRSSLPALLLGTLFLGMFAGCAVGPRYKTPDMKLPDAWQQKMTEGILEEEPYIQTWWTTLQDPTLNSLVERAAAGNLSLQEAFARINEAHANLGIARSDRFPTLDGTGYFERSRNSEDIGPGNADGKFTDNYYGTALDATWEVDLWGRITRSIQSADASLQAMVDNYRDVLVVLYAEIAYNYVDVRTLQERIKYAEGNTGTQSKTLQLTRDRFKAEITGELDVRQAELNLARTESAIPTLKTDLTQAINQLGVLLGEYPEALHKELAQAKPMPRVHEKISVGLPAELLRQRPDIRRAERQLAAQTARIGVATADLLPQFMLDGTIGFEGTKDFIDHSRMTWALKPNFRWKLFEGGAVSGQIKVEQARTEEALANYTRTVLAGLEDVEDSMVAYIQERERRDILARSVVAARRSVQLVDTLYKTGLTDFQNVQDMQRTLFLQQDDYAKSQGQVTKNLIRIYKALGGGWSPDEPTYKKGVLDKVKDKLKLPTGVL